MNLKQRQDGYWEIEGTRADLTYVPKVKQLCDAMFIPNLDEEEERELLIKIIDNKLDAGEI